MTKFSKDRLAETGYAAGWAAVKFFPAKAGQAVFRAFADRAVRQQGKGVRQLRANLRRVVGPEMSEAELAELTRAGMRSYARYWYEVFRLPAMDKREVAKIVDSRTTGAHHIDEAVKAGNGLVLALPHSGNWDVAGVWLINHGVPFTTVAERIKPESLFERFLAYRRGLGMEVLPLTGGEQAPFEVLQERLRAGGVVCLLADRDLTPSGVPVDFFGEAAKMPAGPALLAATTGAALVPVELWYEEDAWAQRIHPPVEVPAEGKLRDKVTHTTQALADCFGASIARHPQDWHMLQKLWLSDFPADRARPTSELGELPPIVGDEGQGQ